MQLQLPVGVLLVFHIQVFERGNEGLSLEAASGPSGYGRVADGALGADGGDVAPEWCARVARFVSRLSHATYVEASAEVDAVQDLCTQTHTK